MSCELDFINLVNFKQFIETTRQLKEVLNKTEYFNVIPKERTPKGEEIMKKYFNHKQSTKKKKAKKSFLNIEKFSSKQKPSYCFKQVWSFKKFNKINPDLSLDNVIDIISSALTQSKRFQLKEEETLGYLSLYDYNINLTLESIKRTNNSN
jgi:hypothetical protein